MLFTAMMILGVVSYSMLPVQLLPDFTVPTVGIRINNPQSSTENTLENYTKPVEGIVAELPGVKEINSRTGTWGSWITVDFDEGTDIRFVTLDLQERLNAFNEDLPDRRSSIQVFPFTTDNFKNFLMEVSVEGDVDQPTLERIARNQIAPRLRAIEGIARVETGGLTAKAATIEVDIDRLDANGISIGALFSRLNSAQVRETYLGGWGQSGERSFVRLEPEVETLEDLVYLPLDNSGIVRLSDVASVGVGNAVEGWQYRANGNNAIGLQIEREEGKNLIRTAKLLKERIDEINETLEGQINLTIQTDIAEIVQEVIDDVSFLALQGAALALIIPLFFFRSLRVSLIIFVSVPISMLTVFNLFTIFDMTINIFSVIGLALGVGILVDNSIVVVESILTNFQEKKMGAIEAACKGGTDVGRALLASTLTTGAPFVGLAFLDGRFKMIIREPALALIFPLIVSLFVALTLSAMLTSLVLLTKKPAMGKPLGISNLSVPQKVFRSLLRVSLRNKGRLLLTILALLIFVFFEACNTIRQASTNDDDSRDIFRLYAVMPADTPTRPVAAPIRYIEEKLREHPEIENFSVFYRQSRANFDITLYPPDERESDRSIQEIREEFIDFIGPYPGTTITLENPEVGAETDVIEFANSGTFRLEGENRESLEAYADRVIQLMTVDPAIEEAKVDEDEDLKIAELLPDAELMQVLGISNQQITQLLGITQSGGSVTSLQIGDGEDRIDVSVVFRDSEVDTLADVMRLQAGSDEQSSRIALSEITTMNFRSADSFIRRTNRLSSVRVRYSWNGDMTRQEITDRVTEIASRLPNPAGVALLADGAQLDIDNRSRDFLFIMMIGSLLIYIVMAAAFENYWVPFTIIVTNPLMLIGITMALYLFDLPFEDLAAFGVILLIGLAVNNGIVMMDLAMHLRRDKEYSPLRAVYQASLARVRPILMTYSTTVAGMIPLAFGGDDSSDWKPVAVTVIGGLTSATILTLVVLPAFYMTGQAIVDSTGRYFSRFRKPSLRAIPGFILRVLLVMMPWKWYWRQTAHAGAENLQVIYFDRDEDKGEPWQYRTGVTELKSDHPVFTRKNLFARIIADHQHFRGDASDVTYTLPDIDSGDLKRLRVRQLLKILRRRKGLFFNRSEKYSWRDFRYLTKSVKRLRRKKWSALSEKEKSLLSLWLFLDSGFEVGVLPAFNQETIADEAWNINIESMYEGKIILGRHD